MYDTPTGDCHANPTGQLLKWILVRPHQDILTDSLLSHSLAKPQKRITLSSLNHCNNPHISFALCTRLSLRQLSPQLGVGEPCSEQPTKKDILQNCSATCACCSLCRTAHDRSRRWVRDESGCSRKNQEQKSTHFPKRAYNSIVLHQVDETICSR